jgi:hypothetical protein
MEACIWVIFEGTGVFLDKKGVFSKLSKPILGPKTHVERFWGTLKHENTLLVAIGRQIAHF